MDSGFSSSPPEALPSPTTTQSAMDENCAKTPTLAGRQMSASLRERLKRSGRSYSSPTTSKRIQLCPRKDINAKTDNATQGNHTEAGDSNLETCTSTPDLVTIPTNLAKTVVTPCPGDIDENLEAETETLPVSTTGVPASPLCKMVVSRTGLSENVHTLRVTRLNLQDSIAKKEERLRKLKMVKMYRAKNDLSELKVLITKWRETSQGALHELLELSQSEPKPSLTRLIEHLGVDPTLLHFNREDETFT